MTNQEYKRIGRILKEVYKEIEDEAKAIGLSLISDEFEEAISNARKITLEKLGYSVEEYLAIKGRNADELAKTKHKIENIQEELESEKQREIPSTEDIEEIAERISEQVAERIAKKYIKPPQVKIVNKIVEKIKEPKIIKETVKVTERVEYNEKPLQDKISKLSKKIDDIDIPDPIDVIKLKEELESDFQKNLKHNIDMLGMPDFRKLAMGLRQDIDELRQRESDEVEDDRYFKLDQTTPQTITNTGMPSDSVQIMNGNYSIYGVGVSFFEDIGANRSVALIDATYAISVTGPSLFDDGLSQTALTLTDGTYAINATGSVKADNFIGISKNTYFV